MKSPLFLRMVPVALFLYVSSPFFSYGRNPASAIASPSNAQGAQIPEAATPRSSSDVVIPGPLRSFLRMAGISQKASPEEVLPLLARNVFAQGYQGWQGSAGRTEFLVLLMRYVQQARELTALAGPEGVIRVSNCNEAEPLLRVLGYRLRQDCGLSGNSLVTAAPERAFLTIDSGFPLPELETALQGNKPFNYAFAASPVPGWFPESDWMSVSKHNIKDTKDLVDGLLRDPALARLYWAMSRLDAETGSALRQSPGLRELLPFGPVLDFYGSHIRIRSGRVMVPGGAEAEPAWKDLVGASPESAGEFVSKLLAKDKGWLAAYFDALSRVNQHQRAHFTTSQRLRRFYEAFRAPDLSSDAARASFRPAPGLLLLVTRLQWEPNGDPHVPGNLQVWKEIFRQKTDSKIVREWGRRASHWTRPEQLMQAMFAISRVETDEGPLQIYLTLSELDRRRPPERQLSPQTVLLLAKKFAQFSNQYLIFSEFPELSDASITHFLKVAEAMDKIPSHILRGNVMGIFQANIGLWQILARQGQISGAALDDSWQNLIRPFADIRSSAQLFDAGRSSLRQVLLAASGNPHASQDEIIELLAGPYQTSPEGKQMQHELADRMRSVLDGQRLVSLDTLLALGDGLKEMARGKPIGDSLVPLAGELREFEMPRPMFTRSERSQWAAGIYSNRHTELQMRTDLTKVIKSPGSGAQLQEAPGQLAPYMRDVLVGLNYAYYAPPGAQLLHHNPLFVRSHDFSGDTVAGVERVWQTPQLFGVGSPAGGGAHLVGSLADLPYVLSLTEQDFIAPDSVQALIWTELVPGLLTSAILPRWWGVSRIELHAIALYQRAGEELLTASVKNERLRSQVMNILSDRTAPQTSERVEQALRAGRVEEILTRITPADIFYLTSEFRRAFSQETDSWGPSGLELENITRRYPTELSWERLSRDFGVPHPILAQSYARELLNVKPFPVFEGYSSRLLAESWDSSNLYWARLADEMGYPPVMLNRLIPELTRRMVEKIFATDVEDWHAILRAMQETGEEFRQGKIALLSTRSTTSRP
jgi:hypothetical protein